MIWQIDKCSYLETSIFAGGTGCLLGVNVSIRYKWSTPSDVWLLIYEKEDSIYTSPFRPPVLRVILSFPSLPSLPYTFLGSSLALILIVSSINIQNYDNVFQRKGRGMQEVVT